MFFFFLFQGQFFGKIYEMKIYFFVMYRSMQLVNKKTVKPLSGSNPLILTSILENVTCDG